MKRAKEGDRAYSGREETCMHELAGTKMRTRGGNELGLGVS